MPIIREQVVQTAERYVSRGKVEAAIREYKKVLAENPNDTNTLNRVGDLYARIQRIDEAVDFFTQIAQQYSDEGFFVKAIAIYKKIIKLNPTQLEVYEKLAELYHKQGLVNEARTQYHVLADYYIKHENPTSAIAIYLKMAELEPENPTYHVKLAELYQQQKLTEKALQEHRIIAELMIAHGHPAEAAQVYERALDIDSSNVGFLTDAVMKLKAAGHTDSARRLLTAAVERNPQAEKIGRLTGLEETMTGPAPGLAAPAQRRREPEPAVEAQPEPASYEIQDEELVPWGDRPVYPDEPPAEESADEPAAASELDVELELDLDFAAEDGAPAATAPPYSAPQRAPEPAARRDEEEFDLDLDDVFVLDMEGEDEPASLVKPPPDMLGEEIRRPAWAQTPGSGASPLETLGSGEEVVEEAFELGELGDLGDDVPADFARLGETADEAPPALLGLEAAEEAVLELDLDGAFDLDSLQAPDLPEGPSLAEEPAGAAVPAAAAPDPASDRAPAELPAGHIDPDLLERTAAELHPENLHREEDLVSEAEVLAKYGLEDKALERLREALRLDPRHLAAYGLMIQLHLDKGRHGRVIELAAQMARIATAGGSGGRESWQKVRRRLLAAGYRFDGDQVLAAPAGDRLPGPSPAPAAPAPPPPPAAVAPPAEAVPAAAPGAARPARKSKDVDDMLRGLLDKPGKRPAPAAPRAPATPPTPPPPPAPPAAAPAAAAEAVPSAAAPPPPAAAAPPPAPPPSGMFNPLEIGQMVDEADLDEGLDLTSEPFVPPPPAALPAKPAASSFLDDTGMSWLDEAEAGRARPAAAARGEGRIFSEEDDFFDLAGELEQELSREAGFEGSDLLAPVEQSLEQIVEGFKKGVAENLSPTDFDTHFNLGIAYREMGLIDEAIGEFQLAAKSPSLLVSCCSMLGLCFLEKGLPELAIKWYRRGLEAPGISEDDHLGLLYDLGNVYETTGDRTTAYKVFVELYGINTNYRDVVARIEDLGRSN